ncbi:Methionine aminopeptidase [Candidatus Portiera aleyrodidarum]|uniref:Methionine aminopeptidase n=1 Tax=Candidatus Portiera aleyrodidarum TaxID=91844 RepID=A0A6S6RTM9_9GAMM|nr:type I methionyl aminopeptidase [Candidatus Portiera aleyrodidarum]CAA3708630.1 Methionine aminopeptidase [Candidatus Portiera aleyrodidarum]
MTIKIYSLKDIKQLIFVGNLAAKILALINEYIKSEINTEEINNICHKYIETKIRCISATIGYKGYQHATCISTNNIVCHGIPNYKKQIKTNDILNIDVTIIKNGYYADTSSMYIVGNKRKKKTYKVCKRAQECLNKAISVLCDGANLSKVGDTIQTHAKKNGYSVVKEFCGHGVGTDFHLKPQVLNYNGYNNNDVLLKQGMCLTVEPILINRGTAIKILKDGWTTTTQNKSNSAQWEHTLIIKQTGVVLTTIR